MTTINNQYRYKTFANNNNSEEEAQENSIFESEDSDQ
jgi:hypothetical protein